MNICISFNIKDRNLQMIFLLKVYKIVLLFTKDQELPFNKKKEEFLA